MINKGSSKTLRIRGKIWQDLKVLAAQKKTYMIDLAEIFIKFGIEDEKNKEERNKIIT